MMRAQAQLLLRHHRNDCVAEPVAAALKQRRRVEDDQLLPLGPEAVDGRLDGPDDVGEDDLVEAAQLRFVVKDDLPELFSG